MYLIINEDYTLEKSEVLSGKMVIKARLGEISIVNCRTMQGINTREYQNEGNPEWSDIPDYAHGETIDTTCDEEIH